MNYDELRSKPVKQNSERSNHDFHLRLSKTEKERLIMLTKSTNHSTMASFIRSKIFQPDLHLKLDMILRQIKQMEKNG